MVRLSSSFPILIFIITTLALSLAIEAFVISQPGVHRIHSNGLKEKTFMVNQRRPSVQLQDGNSDDEEHLDGSIISNSNRQQSRRSAFSTSGKMLASLLLSTTYINNTGNIPVANAAIKLDSSSPRTILVTGTFCPFTVYSDLLVGHCI